MDGPDGKNGSQSVRVAVNVRPLVTPELLVGCSDCISVTPGEPQVQIGSHSFTFDYVYGSTGYPSSRIFDDCVAPLVDALFHGYNATVLAYGQTGSGKTYTMGTNYNGEGSNGVIPKVMEMIFKQVEETKGTTEFLIRVSFIEIFKEEVFDLLESNSAAYSKADGNGKPAGPSRAPIQIRETANGGISLAGVTEAEVTSQEEMASFLLRGSVCRATGSTNMNSQSSRSHAIFTITMEQKRISGSTNGGAHDDGDDILCAKLHLVDLAGSERAKKTGADGMRLREGIHINKGLLALGNVISALGDEKKRKEGGHVPYRDSKLTRLLQDSLGGNSKTVMIACVSPADTNAEETLNTLKYANRARNIQNKAVVNRDPVTAQMQQMRNQIEQLQAELLYVKGDSSTPFEELQLLKQKIAILETSNADLQKQLQEHQVNFEHLTKQATDAQFEKDKLLLKLESARDGKPWDENNCDSNKDVGLLKTYVSKIQELEGELMRTRRSNTSKRTELIDFLDLDESVLNPKSNLFPGSDSKPAEDAGNPEDEEKELEHCSLQEKLDNELKELDKKLEQKEAEMKRVAGGDTSVLKQHYEKKVLDLEQEKRALQKEIEQLRNNLANISTTSDDSTQKLKENYLQKLNFLEAQVVELKKKQDAQAQLLRQKQKSDEAARKLQDEIHRIKTQKVQLQQKIKQESEQFRLWKASREKEVLQLKKEGRRNEYEMHKLLALNQRQKMVVQRKTEEAALATKRLKEVLDSRKTSSRDTYGSSSGPGVQALMQAIEHELEVYVRVHEVRCEHERQKEERVKMAKELAELKDEANMAKHSSLSVCGQTMSPGARNARIYALDNMLATSSKTIVAMASQLSEAEEREKAFSGKGRWNQVRSLQDAKNIMNYLFNLASSSRCQVWEKEVACREKDTEIRGLKEKIVNLIRQIEMHKAELIRQEKLKKMMMSKSFRKRSTNQDDDGEGHVYDLRPKGLRNSIAYNTSGDLDELLEDMDTSDSDNSDNSDDWLHSDDFQDEWGNRRKQTAKRNSKADFTDSEIQKTSPTEEGSTGENPKVPFGECCTCSKSSSCKTMKCQCRAAEGMCSASCGCNPKKCSNRETAVVVEQSDSRPPLPAPPVAVLVDGDVNLSDDQELANRAAMLLESALGDKPAEINNEVEGSKRKPLSDIGNKVAKSNAPKPPAPRKKWRKSAAIKLIPVVAPPPSQTEETETEAPQTQKQESNNNNNSCVAVETTNIPQTLRLPRAMRSAMSNPNNSISNPPLRDRNSQQNQFGDSTANKEPEHATAIPLRPTTNEKENNNNHGI
ncbi:kinesin-like protein KIN-4C [Lactuca sativa]|uniref:kinesin-like protein KIN-4C n=1 Tax=Lactuca sativa TaxID=4236 RepID=UPI000CB96C65|nr:kinesin-like protein KIN-4C [Lactuca sativa]